MFGFSVDVWGPPDLGGGDVSLDTGGGGDVSLDSGGGGTEQDVDVANSTVDPPVALTCTNCVVSAGSLLEGNHSVTLRWSAPGFGRIRTYYIWRADVTSAPMSKTNPPVNIGKVSGTPPVTTFTDNGVKNKTTYRYFVTAALGADSGKNNGNQSGPSNQLPVTVNFSF